VGRERRESENRNIEKLEKIDVEMPNLVVKEKEIAK